MKMTKQEQKEEPRKPKATRSSRGGFARLQQQMARKRMMAEVPKADVVITNPTHLSVALCLHSGARWMPPGWLPRGQTIWR